MFGADRSATQAEAEAEAARARWRRRPPATGDRRAVRRGGARAGRREDDRGAGR